MAQSNTAGLSLRRHNRSSGIDHETASMTVNRYGDTEWEAKEALRQRELEEARARAAQMEKTMRWWSDCTANWREKWSKVRNERNKAREEIKILRTKLEVAMKDSNTFRREKIDLETQNDELKKEMEKMHVLLIKHAGQWDQKILEALETTERHELSKMEDVPNDEIYSFDKFKSTLETDKASTSTSSDQKLDFDENALKPEELESSSSNYDVRLSPDSNSERKQKRLSILKNEQLPYDEEFVLQKLSVLQLKLEEATKTIQGERDEKITLHKTIERLRSELKETKEKYEDLKLVKQDAVRELLLLQDQHRDSIESDLHDEINSRETVDRRIADLRAELERLQAEKASEWGKRERLETEKLSLERDNKKLRAEVRDLHEQLELKGNQASADTDWRTYMQQELSEKYKELAELRHSHFKLKKVLQDKMTESAEAIRRAEQYESEAKRLRVRVEELKRELAVAKDDFDSASYDIRRLQETNNELQEQVDNLQTEIDSYIIE